MSEYSFERDMLAYCAEPENVNTAECNLFRRYYNNRFILDDVYKEILNLIEVVYDFDSGTHGALLVQLMIDIDRKVDEAITPFVEEQEQIQDEIAAMAAMYSGQINEINSDISFIIDAEIPRLDNRIDIVTEDINRVFQEMETEIADAIKGAIDEVTDWITAEIYRLTEKISDMVVWVIRQIGQAISAASTLIKEAVNKIQTQLNDIKNWVNGLVAELKDWVLKQIDITIESITNAINEIANYLGELIDTYINPLINFVEMLANFVLNPSVSAVHEIFATEEDRKDIAASLISAQNDVNKFFGIQETPKIEYKTSWIKGV